MNRLLAIYHSILFLMLTLFVIDSVLKFYGKNGIPGIPRYVRKEEREKYDELSLRHFHAKVSFANTLAMMLMLIGLSFHPPLFETSWFFLLGIFGLIAISFFERKYMKDYGSVFEKLPPDDERDAAAAVRRRKQRRIWLGVTGVATAAFIALFAYAESDPRLEIGYFYHGPELRIRAVYGRTIALADITSVTLFEYSMNDLGFSATTGRRITGGRYTVFLGAKRGFFEQGLLYVQPRQSPTIRIEYYARDAMFEPLPHNIFISFRNPDTTREWYARLTYELNHQ